jgi:hypothetical protein
MLELNIHPYCNCHIRGAYRKQDGYTLDPPSGLWVCSRCRKPSKMNYERSMLGIQPIPQPKRDVDIYMFELLFEFRKEARKEVEDALNWEEDSEDDYDYAND